MVILPIGIAIVVISCNLAWDQSIHRSRFFFGGEVSHVPPGISTGRSLKLLCLVKDMWYFFWTWIAASRSYPGCPCVKLASDLWDLGSSLRHKEGQQGKTILGIPPLQYPFPISSKSISMLERALLSTECHQHLNDAPSGAFGWDLPQLIVSVQPRTVTFEFKRATSSYVSWRCNLICIIST